MEIITTAAQAANAKSTLNNASTANASYSKSLMASRALMTGGRSNEVSISQLEKGDVFKGEITNMTGRNVTVSLGNGQMLSATVMDDVPLNIGNSLYFEVKENTGETVYLRPLTDEKFSPQNQTIERSLLSAGLQLNEKNMAVVKALMEAGMPIDRSSIMRILQQLVNHPNASIATIVSMTKVNLPITDGNLTQFEQYQNQDRALLGHIDTTVEQITSAYESLGEEEAFAGDIIRFNHGVLEAFAKGADSSLSPHSLKNVFYMEPAEVEQFYASDAPMALDREGNPVLNEQGLAYPKGSIVLKDGMTPLLDQNGNVVMTEEYLSELSRTYPEATKEELAARFQNGEFQIPLAKTYPNEIQASFASRLKMIGVSDEAIHMMLDPNHTAEELARSVTDYLEQNDKLNDDVIKQFLSSKEYTVLVESIVNHQWKLSPEQLKEPDALSKLYTRMAQQSEQLSLASKGFSFEEEFHGHSRNMQENLQFIKDINENYTYAQLPIQLTNQDVNSELYVYTNKKALSKDKKDIQVLLHLDMEHLGSTDIHVQLNGDKVTARFYLDDNRSVNTVSMNMDQLRERIRTLHLTLDTEVVKRAGTKTKEVEDFSKDFLEKEVPQSHQIKRYTFDMRA